MLVPNSWFEWKRTMHKFIVVSLDIALMFQVIRKFLLWKHLKILIFRDIPPYSCAHIKTSRTTGSFVGIANSFFLEDLKTETSPIESGLAQSASLAKIEILKPRWCRAAENMAFEKYYFHLIFLHLPFSFVRHQKWPNAVLKLSNKKVQLFAI